MRGIVLLLLSVSTLVSSNSLASVAKDEVFKDWMVIIDKVFTVAEQNKAEIEADASVLEEHILPIVDSSFDVNLFTQYALGIHKRKITSEEDLIRFQEVSIRLLARTYSRALSTTGRQSLVLTRVDMVNTKPGANLKAKVTATVDAGSVKAVSLKFFMVKRAETPWRIWDVSIDGLRQTVNFKNTHLKEIKRLGFLGVVTKLEKEVGITTAATASD